MNWSDLHVLRVFHHAGSLKEAASRLGVNHTTVSRRIRELGISLDCRLVEHVGGRLMLTPDGELVLSAAERMAAESDALLRELAGKDGELKGPLRVALLDLQLHTHMELFAQFRKLHPGVELELLSASNSTHSLVKREADVALRTTLQPRATLVGRRLMRLEYAVFVHQEIADTPRETWPWLGWHASVRARLTDQWMERHLQEHQTVTRVDSALSMLELARRGIGASILPVPYARSHGDLVQVSDTLEGFHTDLWALTHRDLASNARVRAFMDLVYDGFSEFQAKTA